MTCRICNGITHEILNLGETPPANSLIDSMSTMQLSFPLVLELCEGCHNVQLKYCMNSEELYRNYLYVTPDSSMLKSHYEYLFNYLQASSYVNEDSFVVEVGSNVGHFLQFIKPNVSRVLGVDPAENICMMAIENGVDTLCDFFNPDSAKAIKNKSGPADLIVARHCFAHNSDPHILMQGVNNLLSDSGYIVIENAYILNTLENNEFDQVYHEHMFYYSIRSMMELLVRNGLQLVDVLISLVHGGSIIFVAKRESQKNYVNASVTQYLAREQLFIGPSAFKQFSEKAYGIKNQLKSLIDQLEGENKTIFTYGATAKGNTLLNFVGITSKQIPFCIDSTPLKQGKFLPKSNIKIISEIDGLLNPPDYFLLTAWNYKDEIIKKVRMAGNYHSKFIIPFPFVHVV
ncbi:MAG: class I SAM-dependent methyltransferase [Methylovulum sp.]|nr:class I SAM-dependent methyltransferase [Methylovulum sp.]